MRHYFTFAFFCAVFKEHFLDFQFTTLDFRFSSNVAGRSSNIEMNQQLPNLPGRFQPSTFGVYGLNYCVRYGNRWSPTAIVTGFFCFRNIYVIIVTCVFQQVTYGNWHSLKTKQCKCLCICQMYRPRSSSIFMSKVKGRLSNVEQFSLERR